MTWRKRLCIPRPPNDYDDAFGGENMRFLWTTDRLLTLLSERTKGRSFRVIAASLGTTELSARDKHKRLKEGTDSMPVRVEMVERKCLLCGGDFTAKGRFMRVCGPCKGTREWRSSGSNFSVGA